MPPAAGGSWAKQSLVLVLTRMKKSVDRYIYSASCYSQSLHTFSRRHSTLRNGMLGWPCVPVCSAGLQASTAEHWTEHLLDQLWSSGGVSNFGFCRCNSGSPAWTCNIKVPLQLLLDWCNAQFKIGAFKESHSFAVQSWCFLISNLALVIHASVCLRAAWRTRFVSQLRTHSNVSLCWNTHSLSCFCASCSLLIA